MKNHYSTLGVSRYASRHEIKAAYKKLALKYHPDLNPHKMAAEELFKLINEAYHVLGNPERKEKYDILLDFHLYRKQTESAPTYQPYTYRRQAPQRRYKTGYKFDKNYFKNQALAILFVLAVSSIVITITRVNRYMKFKEHEEIRMENQKVISSAQMKFNLGDFYGALVMVQDLAKKHPADFELDVQRDKMIEELYQKARRQYVLQDYENSIFNLLIVKEFQHPQKMETYDYLARCYEALKDYQKAVAAYEYIYLRDNQNIQLMMRIAKLYHYELQELEKSITYYDKAKRQFKERQKQLYGEAFELLMDPQRTPEHYYDIFYHRAVANLEMKEFNTAITDCNWAIFLRPKEAEPFYFRAYSYNVINEPEKACKDYHQALQNGFNPHPDFNFCKNLL